MTGTLRGEWYRKGLHLAMMIIPLGVWFWPPAIWRWIFLLLTAAVLVLDFARLGDHRFGRFFRALVGPSLREHEERELLGSSYLALGCILAAFVYPKPVAVAAMGYIILGDGLAGLVGRNWGRVPLAFGKTLEGTLACLLACLLVGALVFRESAPTLLGAALATAIELLPLPVDDNLAIPVVTGAVLWWALI